MIDHLQSDEEFYAGFNPPVINVDPIGPTAALRARIVELEAENARLATRVNEMISITAMDH